MDGLSLTFILLFPPVVFVLLVAFFVILSYFTGKISYKNPDNAAGKRKPYACGEDIKEHRIKPDYREFFPYAFFFTLMHVIVLMIATSPENIDETLAIALFFIAAAFLSILIIFRSERND